MSNVKAGDLAIVVGCVNVPRANGRIVEVISCAPKSRFQLPDGVWIFPTTSELAWVTKYVGGRGPFLTLGGALSESLYTCIADIRLRPLPGDESTTTTEREVTA